MSFYDFISRNEVALGAPNLVQNKMTDTCIKDLAKVLQRSGWHSVS